MTNIEINYPSKSGPRYPVAWVRFLFAALMVAAMFAIGRMSDPTTLPAPNTMHTQFFVFTMLTSIVMEWTFFLHQWNTRRFFLTRRDYIYFFIQGTLGFVLPSFFLSEIAPRFLPSGLVPDFLIGTHWLSFFTDAVLLGMHIELVRNLREYRRRYFTTAAFLQKDKVEYLNMLDIAVITQDENHLRLTGLNGKIHFLKYGKRLEEFYESLDPYYFFQINDDTIINRKAIKEVREVYGEEED